MLLAQEGTLEDRLVSRLLESPSQVKRLHAELSREKHVSLRAVYDAVNALISGGVLVKAGKVVRIDQEWARGVRSKFSPSPLPELSAGERVSYRFSSISHLDTFWKTILLGLEDHEQDGQVFFYNPHDFWVLLSDRKESEDAYYRHFAESKIHAFFTLGATTAQDLAFKRQYQNDYLQIDAREMPGFARADHLTILGDFVITVRIGRTLAARIDECYARELPAGDLASAITALCGAPSGARLVLERNPAKARKLRKQLSLHFYFWRPN